MQLQRCARIGAANSAARATQRIGSGGEEEDGVRTVTRREGGEDEDADEDEDEDEMEKEKQKQDWMVASASGDRATMPMSAEQPGAQCELHNLLKNALDLVRQALAAIRSRLH
mmetsp:Transcript_33113/g.69291  ORF Transcript_33113/g.69291 Transcript_33113/m.69291 type:complete len:113 (-) Transcript_33113:194-532(-)